MTFYDDEPGGDGDFELVYAEWVYDRECEITGGNAGG
jgi:hypothetical protein